MANIGSLLATLGVDTAGLAKAQEDFIKFEKSVDQSVSRMNISVDKFGRKMQDVGKTMSLYVTTAMVGIGTGAFAMSKSFEQSMSQIVGLVGVAQEQVDQWGKDILTMAPKLGKSPKELAEALFFITSAGIKGAAAMDVLEMSAKAAASGLGETKSVADLVTSAMNAYGQGNLNAGAATDILVAAVREGKAEASALAGAMGQVLPFSSNLGVSFDQTAAAIAAMTRTGKEATMATTNLKAIFASFLKPTSEAETALKKMGMTSQGLKETLARDGLIKTLVDLKKKIEATPEVDMADLFPNVEALGGVLDLLGSNVDANIAIFKSLADASGALDHAFETTAKTAEQIYQEALMSSQTALVSLGKEISKSFIPILQWVSKALQGLTKWFSELGDGAKNFIMVVGAIVAATGPLLVVLGFLVTNVLPGIVTAAGAAAKALKFLQLVIMSNPWLAVATAIAAVVAALIIFRKKSDDAAKSQKELNAAMKEAIRLQESMKTIDDRMKVTGGMDKRQLTTLMDDIKRQIDAEQDLTLQLRAEAMKRVENHESYQKLSAEVTEAFNRAEAVTGDAHMKSMATAYAAGLKWKLKQLERSLIAEENAEYKSNNQRLKTLQEYAQKVDAAIAAIPDVTTPDAPGAPIGDTESISTILKDLEKELSFIEEMSKTLGADFDALSARATAFGNAIQSGLKLPGINAANSNIKDFAAQLKAVEAAQKTAFSDDVIKSMNKELAHSAVMLSLQGDTMGNIGTQMGIQKGAIEALVETWGDLESMPESVRLEIDKLLASLTNLKKVSEEMAVNKSIDDSLAGLQEQIKLIDFRAKMEGKSFDSLQAQADAYAQTIMGIAGQDMSAESLDLLVEKWKALQTQIQGAAAQVEQFNMISQILTQNLSSGFGELGEALGKAMLEGADGAEMMKAAMIAMGNTALNIIEGVIQALLAKAIAGMIAGEASKGLLGLATAAIGVGVLKTMWGAQVPKMAKGGMVYGETMVTVGEYPGASVNPEVIAPLKDLQSMIGGGNSGPATVVLRGPDLYLIWEKEHNRRRNNS